MVLESPGENIVVSWNFSKVNSCLIGLLSNSTNSGLSPLMCSTYLKPVWYDQQSVILPILSADFFSQLP